jgi:hypothetical protein
MRNEKIPVQIISKDSKFFLRNVDRLGKFRLLIWKFPGKSVDLTQET